MASRKAKADPHITWLNEQLERDLHEIRRPFQAQQDKVKARYSKQIRRLTERCAFEVEVIEQQYLVEEDMYRQTRGARVDEGPGSYGWSQYQIRRLARNGYGLRTRGDGTWEIVNPEAQT